MNEANFVHTSRVLIVEGKYDAARLSHLTDAMILLTDGFAIYKDKKRQQLFKALAKKNGLILLTDSDAAGFRIRNYITNLVGARNVVQAYVPAIHGKEKRKPQPGKEGLLGVEGVDDAIVVKILREALGTEADAAALIGSALLSLHIESGSEEAMAVVPVLTFFVALWLDRKSVV